MPKHPKLADEKAREIMGEFSDEALLPELHNQLPTPNCEKWSAALRQQSDCAERVAQEAQVSKQVAETAVIHILRERRKARREQFGQVVQVNYYKR